MRKEGLIIFFCLLYLNIFSQDSCQTIPYYPLNILSNPSFENTTQPCSSGFQDIPFWYSPTNEVPTAFLNACTNFLISDSLMIAYSFISPNITFFPTVPQPIPDGNGVAAITDYGYFNGTYYVYPYHKSYVSTCLTSPLEKDSLYRFEFYVGFGGLGNEYLQVHNQLLIPEYSQSPEKFTLFGLADCSSIDVSIPFLGCLSIAGWTNLGSVTVSSDTGQWVKAAINFSPGQQIKAIALGPACDTIFVPYPDTYFYKGEQVTAQQFSYFLDKLQFFQSSVPKPIVSQVSGNPCSSSVVLQMQPAVYYAGSNLQWYKNDTVLIGQQGNTLTVLRDKPGEAFYSCRVQNDTVCLLSDSFPLVWAPIPDGSILGTPDTTVCIGDTVLLNAFTDTSFTYTWQNGVSGPSLSATQSGTYSLTISNQCGTAHATKTIDFGKCDLSPSVPNAFTPNGDGLNDIFKVHYSKMPLQFSMRIFNRNGMELFSTTNPGTGWDGRFNGVGQPAGSYVWFIKYEDEKAIDHELKGVLVLVR